MNVICSFKVLISHSRLKAVNKATLQGHNKIYISTISKTQPNLPKQLFSPYALSNKAILHAFLNAGTEGTLGTYFGRPFQRTGRTREKFCDLTVAIWTLLKETPSEGG